MVEGGHIFESYGSTEEGEKNGMYNCKRNSVKLVEKESDKLCYKQCGNDERTLAKSM